MSADSVKLLAEKLALIRELAHLQPELEHLRSQALTHQNLLSEKLSLQQQLEVAQNGLEDSNRKLQRAVAKEGKLNEQDARYETEIEELEKQLAMAKKDQAKVEKRLNAEASEQLAMFQKELAKERKEREDAGKLIDEEVAEQVKLLDKELVKERKARERTEKAAESKNSDEVSLLKKELAKEKRAREKAEQAGAIREEKVELLGSLQGELNEAKKARAAAEKAADALRENVEEIQALRKELLKEKKAREKAEKSLSSKADDDEALTMAREEHSKELAKERKAREKVEQALASRSDAIDEQVDNLVKELKAEQSLRATAEKQLSKSATDFEGQRSVLDDKLEQFRSKLRSTKEKLKEAEKDLAETRNQAHVLPSVICKTATKTVNPRKRPITQVTIDPDATIGTPGDGPGGRATKRGKRASSVVGEKSTFSITPFLNRTSKVAPEDLPLASIEESDASPTLERTKEPTTRVASNVKVPTVRRKGTAAPSKLTQVAEEEQSETNVEQTVASGVNDENLPPVVLDNAEKVKDNSKPKMKLKVSSNNVLKPKSLSSFATFRDGSVPPQYHRQQSVSVGPQQQQKKKRKLVGLASTIFDEDEEDVVAGPAAAMKGLGGQRAFGAFGIGRGLGGLSALGKSKGAGLKRGPLIVAKEDGFMFSPLKRNKRGTSVVGE